MRTISDRVCATPFPFAGAQTEKRASGLMQVSNYSGLTPLTVLADYVTDDFTRCLYAGDVIYVNAKEVSAPWARDRYKMPDGATECVFVPVASVFLVQESKKQSSSLLAEVGQEST